MKNKRFSLSSMAGLVNKAWPNSQANHSISPEQETAYQSIEQSGLFDANYYLFINQDVNDLGIDPLLHFIVSGALEQRSPSAYFNTALYLKKNPDAHKAGENPLLHYINNGRSIETKILSKYKYYSNDIIDTERDFQTSAILASGYFDASFYLLNNSDVGETGTSAVQHFMEHGWHEFRNPSSGFDLIWYAQNYLESDYNVNPLLHYALEGKAKGYQAKPPLPTNLTKSTKYNKDQGQPKRICLFAGYDANGIIDPVVVEYVADLAKHADVYYLADSYIAKNELKKLEGITKGAWSIRQGMYDFGSWSKLARDLVGWDVIDEYDELIFANDSCYLMRSFDDVFAEMDRRGCNWWGLQATKGLISTLATQKLPREIDLDEIKSEWLDQFEQDNTYDFHAGSYFLVFRKPAHIDARFRSIINNITEESSKLSIIRKYEIGLTRWLISAGHNFEMLVETVYPFQPMFTETSFHLIKDGFPLLKKYHLINNHYRIQALFQWPEWLEKAGITKDLQAYKDNLNRTGDAFELYKNLDLGRHDAHPPLSKDALVAADEITPKYDDWWAFPVCSFSHQFNDNIRALFEHVKNDPSIKKIVLTRSKHIAVSGKNVVVLPIESHLGQFHLLRSRNVFLKHSVNSNTGAPLSPEHHQFHNLWHGIPLKRIGYTSIDMQDHLSWLETENRMLTSVIAASKVDRLAMTAAYWPLTYNHIWQTGLPRHDFITTDEECLPDDMQDELLALRNRLAGRKLILFAPTFRLNQEDGYYSFSDKELESLNSLLTENNCVLGVREHMADKSKQYSSQLHGHCYTSLPETVFPNVEILMREASVLITDYSSVFIDFLLTARPVISFAYDYDHYINSERGLFYDLDWAFPGNITKTFKELETSLLAALSGMNTEEQVLYKQKRMLFIENSDDQNSARVRERVEEENTGSTTIFDISESTFHPNPKRHILWVYDIGFDATARYRVFNLAVALEKMGWHNTIVDSRFLTAEHFTHNQITVFSRVVATDQILDFIAGFQEIGRKVIFDIDDMLFEEITLGQSEYFRDRPKMQDSIRQISRGYRRLMEQADLCVFSTEALVQIAQNIGIDAVCVPNSIDEAIISRFGEDTTPKPKKKGDALKICYLSGTQTHGDDFRLIKAAASKIMKQHNNVEFHIVGKVTIDDAENDKLLKGWVRHKHLTYENMHVFIKGMDINLAPLTSSRFNDCKSELKIFETALHAVPTIASPSASYARTIETGKTGILVKTSKDWFDAMDLLIKNTRKRTTIGKNAQKEFIQRFRAANVANGYLNNVLEPLSELCESLDKI